MICSRLFFIIGKTKKMTISFDISTSCIGYAVFNEVGTLMEMNYIKFDSKKSIFEKLEEFKKRINHVLSLDVKYIAIEEPLEKFKGKFSSSHVIAVLNFFNGMISSYLYDKFKIEPVYYNVNHARSIALPGFKVKRDESSTKYQVWEQVYRLEPQVNWEYGPKSHKLLDENFDSCDAYIVGRCHLETIELQKKKIRI